MELEETKTGATILNVMFNLRPIAVDLPGVAAGPWQFHFTDCASSRSFTEIKRELSDEDEACFIAVVLFEDAKPGKKFFPHRFKVKVVEQPSSFTQFEFKEAIRAALQRVMTEMEIQLRQSCFRSCDPQIGYGKVLNLRHHEIAMTHRTLFV